MSVSYFLKLNIYFVYTRFYLKNVKTQRSAKLNNIVIRAGEPKLEPELSSDIV